ncbi:unnamed protein product [Rotaria magnacalcarata]|uniref:Integrase catalytic domain-containing protein n=1 Tax=Rotaria magnacalcarata TaxID=392030 RepID=A0A816WHI8_9BILA|nr:unnamed protein product [Rotaria magnacalcarata]
MGGNVCFTKNNSYRYLKYSYQRSNLSLRYPDIHLDNGPRFVSQLFKDACDSLGIKRKFTANYHPQTNMTERVNRTLKEQIAIYAQNHSGLWDKEVQKLAFAIRTSINETTGETPAYLNFG